MLQFVLDFIDMLNLKKQKKTSICLIGSKSTKFPQPFQNVEFAFGCVDSRS